MHEFNLDRRQFGKLMALTGLAAVPALASSEARAQQSAD